MPVNWVYQEEGEIVDEIKHAIAAYKEGAWSNATTWGVLANIYERVNHRKAPKWDERTLQDIEYMITMWFPRYANCWYSGLERDCRQIARELERQHGGTFAVAYEY